MTHDDLVEKVARAIEAADLARPHEPYNYLAFADAAIDVVLEEAARVADANALEAWDFGADETRGLMRLQAADIAATIRAMKKD